MGVSYYYFGNIGPYCRITTYYEPLLRYFCCDATAHIWDGDRIDIGICIDKIDDYILFYRALE